MPLTGEQVVRLAAEIDRRWDVLTFTTFLSDNLDIRLGNEAPGGSLKKCAYKIITKLNSQFRPRDRELLEQLQGCSNAALRDLATVLLTPP